MKRSLSKSAQTTEQILIPAGGFIGGQAILENILLKMQDYSTKETAPFVHLTAGDVYARLAHLRKKLQKIL